MTAVHTGIVVLAGAALPALAGAALTGIHAAGSTHKVPAAHRGSSAHASVCEARPTSRWSGGASGYRRDGSFGTDPDQWLQAATGILADDRGEVLVHDGVEGVVHVLTPALWHVRQFGRRGGGPGEFAPLSPMFLMGWDFLHRFVASDGAAVFVFDGVVREYSRTAEFIRTRADLRQHGPGPIYGVRSLHAAGGRLYYAVDALTSNQRHLETWELGEGKAVLRHRLRLAMPPRVGGRIRTVGQEARPVWAAQGDCAVLGDGSSRWLLRLNLVSGAVDTLRLPAHHVELRGRRDIPPPLRDRWGAAPDPTAVWRWREISVDPDGHVWVNPWRPAGEGDFTVYRIDPPGRVHEERVSAFPHAFGPPGVFFSRERSGSSHEVVVVRLTAAR